MTPFRCLIVAACLVPGSILLAAEPAPSSEQARELPASRIRIALRASATVTEQAVCLRDIADLQSEDSALRQQVAALDLVEVPLSGPPTLISRSQVSFRLQLAGIDAARLVFEGPDLVRVSLTPLERLEGRVEAIARHTLLEKLGGKAGDYSLALAQRISVPSLPGDTGEIHLEGEAFGRPALPGRACVNVGIYRRSAHLLTVSVCFDIRPIEPVGVAVRSIAQGEVLNDTNVRIERMPVDHLRGTGSLADLVGRRARRPLSAGHLVALEDVEAAGSSPASPAAGSPVLIHQHDMVSLVVRSGSLNVTARGQALEDGRADQAIRVRNVDSSTVVTGRVVERGVVEVDLLRVGP